MQADASPSNAFVVHQVDSDQHRWIGALQRRGEVRPCTTSMVSSAADATNRPRSGETIEDGHRRTHAIFTAQSVA